MTTSKTITISKNNEIVIKGIIRILDLNKDLPKNNNEYIYNLFLKLINKDITQIESIRGDLEELINVQKIILKENARQELINSISGILIAIGLLFGLLNTLKENIMYEYLFIYMIILGFIAKTISVGIRIKNSPIYQRREKLIKNIIYKVSK